MSGAPLLLLAFGCGYQTHGESTGRDEVAPATEWISADAGVDDVEEEAPAPEPETSGPTVPSHSDPAVTAAIAAWRERAATLGDLPSPDTVQCARRFADLEIVTAPTHDDFRRLCQRCDTTDRSRHCDSLDRVNACAPWGDERDDDGVIGALHALIVVDASLAATPRTRASLVVHETIHHLGTCTGYGADPAHEETFLWCGGPDCVEGSASRGLE